MGIIIGVVALVVIVCAGLWGTGTLDRISLNSAAKSSGIYSMTSTSIKIDRSKKVAIFTLTKNGEKKYINELYNAVAANNPNKELAAEKSLAKVSQSISRNPLMGSKWIITLVDSDEQPVAIFKGNNEIYNFQTSNTGKKLIKELQEKQAEDEASKELGNLVDDFLDDLAN